MPEKIIETRTCRQCGVSYHITDRDMAFYEKVSPVFAGKKELVPPPTMCPECRQRRGFAFRNERKLYRRRCDLSGRDIISIYSPDKPYKVYDQKEWWGDGWSGFDFGRDVDFSGLFLPQVDTLLHSVPHLARYAFDTVGSDYVNGANSIKDSYLCFNATNLEDCFYCSISDYAKDCMDCSFVISLEHCYACTNCTHSFVLSFSYNSHHCSESMFLSDCQNCQNCFACTNLVNRKYCIFNMEYSQQEYKHRIDELFAKKNHHTLYEEFLLFARKYPKKYASCLQTVDTVGNYITEVNNSYAIFDSFNVENSKYVSYINHSKDCMDYDIYGEQSELIYEAIMTGSNIYKSAFCFANWSGSSDIYYSVFTEGCTCCFGCVSLRHKSYCILNKQYTKEEYETIVPRIIAHMRETDEWGEFFPASISPFGYNETVAQEHFPLTRTEALAKGFNWSDYEAPFPQVSKTIP